MLNAKYEVACVGYCPQLEKRMRIRVDFKEIRMVGDPRTYYVKCGYACDYISDGNKCSFKGEHDDQCPIYQSASMD